MQDMIEGRGFEQHVKNLQGTMFYVCQGSCLCGTVNNRRKIIYCYGDLVPRHGELFSEGEGEGGGSQTTPRDLLAAQLGIWVFGLIALLIVLLLIRKSISSLRQNIERVTERLPWNHDDDDLFSNHSAPSPALQHKDTTLESMGSPTIDIRHVDPEGEGPPHTPLPDSDQYHENMLSRSPPWFGAPHAPSPTPTSKLKKLRLKGKDYRKGGDGLRGKNVTEAYRVKEKDLKRTMKF